MSHLGMDELSATLDSALTGADLERALAHLSMCSRCRERQARLALHDDALRRVLADDPDDRVLDEVARRSEAIATAIVRGQPVPPVTTATPLEAEGPSAPPTPRVREYGPIERLTRFAPPEQAAPQTIEQDTTATPARAEEPLPPPRDPSRLIARPDALRASEPIDIAPRLDTDRPERLDPKPKHDIAPRLDTDRPERLAPKPELRLEPEPKPEPESIAEGYDAFNDRAFLGSETGVRPPRVGETPIKKPSDAELESPQRQYRHGGVRRDTPVPAERGPEPGERRGARPKPEERDKGFGVRRAQEPAWARLGLEPDPFSPGMFRDTLTGAVVSPPPMTSGRPAPSRPTPARGGGGSGSRTALIAALATVGGLVIVVLALRIPTAARLSVQWGRPKPGASAPAPAALDVHDATTTPPVDVPVPLPSASAPTGTAATETATPSFCGELLDAQGHALAGALLTVVGTSTSARTDANGHFCLLAPAGSHDIEVVDARGPGTAPRRIRLEFVAGAPESRIVLP